MQVGQLNAAQAKAAVLQLLAAFKVQQGQYEMGHTKVFFRPGGWYG
jgi:myosin heavy subunit